MRSVHEKAAELAALPRVDAELASGRLTVGRGSLMADRSLRVPSQLDRDRQAAEAQGRTRPSWARAR